MKAEMSAGAVFSPAVRFDEKRERKPRVIEDVERDVQHARKQKLSRQRRAAIIYPILVIVGFLGFWEIAASLFHVPSYLLPTPSVIAASVQAHWLNLLQQAYVTTTEIVGGYLLSILIGVPLALAIFLWPPFARSVYPLLVFSQSMPKVAVAPLLIVWFGFGFMPKILIAFLVAFFPIVINTAVGLESIEREKIYLARSMGLSPLATFFKIRLPGSLPSIFGGLKIAVTLAVVGAVVGEFVGGDSGLGYLLMTANGSMDTPLLFAGITVLTLLGFLCFLVVELAERLSVPRHLIAGSASLREAP